MVEQGSPRDKRSRPEHGDVGHAEMGCPGPTPQLGDGFSRAAIRSGCTQSKPYRVSTPKPDFSIGYNESALPQSVRDYLVMLERGRIVYPFLDVEFKGDGSDSAGTLWCATNQILGGTASFLRRLERLKFQLDSHSLQAFSKPIDLVVFAIVTNGTEARLFVTISDDKGTFKTFLLKGFLLYENSGFRRLMSCVESILDWGNGRRHEAIVSALEKLSAMNARVVPFTPRNTLEVIDESDGEGEPEEEPEREGEGEGEGELEGAGGNAPAPPRGLQTRHQPHRPGRPRNRLALNMRGVRKFARLVPAKRKSESGPATRGRYRPRKKPENM